MPRAWRSRIVLGKRVGWKRDPMRPHNLPLVMIGAGLLWFGWFGFNAGSALGANTLASVAWINTMVATAAAALGWLLIEKLRDGHATSLGAASGVVAGLVAITPSCSSVTPVGALVLGFLAGILCALAVGLKFRFGFDDSLDVVGRAPRRRPVGHAGGRPAGHGQRTAGVDGLFYGGGVDQLWQAGRRCLLGAGLLLRAHLRASAWRSRRRSASGSTRRTRSRASTVSSTPSRRTTSPPRVAGVAPSPVVSLTPASQADAEARGVNA